MERSLAGPGMARPLGEGEGPVVPVPGGRRSGRGARRRTAQRWEGLCHPRNSGVGGREKVEEAGHLGPWAVFSEQGSSAAERRPGGQERAPSCTAHFISLWLVVPAGCSPETGSRDSERHVF